ncbi:MAG: BamA/TamA family outer membrane protein [Desulfomicrobium sp.]|nr:BamA/TamA family outer membrane protein [Pseudomonadota bacterium]MBV1711867.1 BamA/TamA family outer membrane protein [Desulfomicrobium sp.]MBU4571044.1 BamA/TamA family outer membrane protein [Pseudomonadota bacterium]MBU4593673.1 BamA/TamA family outer membrane protein [Pseudomonadota bacterium]MBV1719071.1 BamA/TamA family outer membrane protein [Desulfomicrobium sp.]
MPVLQTRIPLIILLALAVFILPAQGHGAAIEYVVEIPALPDGLTPLLSSVSDSVGLKNNPPDSPGLLRRRMAGDIETFVDALKARGYFKAEVAGEVDTTVTPQTVRFMIEPGPRFVFDRPRLILKPDDPMLQDRLRDTLGSLKSGDKYSSSTILDVETALLERLKEQGRPSPATLERKVVADHATERVEVEFTISPGPAATFGATEILGLEDVSEEAVNPELAWKNGTPYDRRQVDKTREQLIRTGLFRSVRIDMDHADGSDTVNMRISLLEAPHRSVRAGLWFFSDLGLGVTAGWTHRNILGAGQELRLDTEVSENLQRANSELILPRMWHPRQNLGLSAQYVHDLTDSYEATNLSLSAIARRPVSDVQVGYGLAYRLSEVDKDDSRRFNLFSVPLLAEYSNADHLLDPSSGIALTSRIEPFTDIGNRETSFVLWSLTGRHYLPLNRDKTMVLATRGRYSLLAGSSRESIPEDMLLYAGGGGSVRGYAHQYAGELDEDDDPLGGVSAVDFSAELRFRINREYGFVLFADGGGAFSGRNPSEREEYFWGVGTGLRYFTPIGPIRLDVAVPLDRRSGVDDLFQVYVSLGQAF